MPGEHRCSTAMRGIPSVHWRVFSAVVNTIRNVEGVRLHLSIFSIEGLNIGTVEDVEYCGGKPSVPWRRDTIQYCRGG